MPMPVLHLSHRGFTLMEIAIVITIIALVTGGLLVGRDLIHASEIRATVGQVERFNTAANTFRLKFNCLPGDCVAPATFGFVAATAGNGDGMIGWCSVSASCRYDGNPAGGAEAQNFWHQLSKVNLIEGPFQAWPAAPSLAGITTPATKLPARRGPGGSAGGWVVGADIPMDSALGEGHMAANTYMMANSSNTILYPSFNYGVYSPADTYAIDAKIDDGLPLRGNVRAFVQPVTTSLPAYSYGFGGGSSGYGPGGSNAAVCVRNDTTPPTYNVPYTGGLGAMWGALCGIVIKAAF